MMEKVLSANQSDKFHLEHSECALHGWTLICTDAYIYKMYEEKKETGRKIEHGGAEECNKRIKPILSENRQRNRQTYR